MRTTRQIHTENMQGPKFNFTREEHDIALRIAHRAVDLAEKSGNHDLRPIDFLMDLEAVHSNGCPLLLAELEMADTFNFAHDVFGIYRHLDRLTGVLQDCFTPRYAAPESPTQH